MRKNVVIILAILMFTVTGCQKKEESRKVEAPKTPAQVVTPQAVPEAAPQKPSAAPAGDPHAAFKTREVPAGTGHKGKVLQTMDAGGYTYLEVEEKGQKIWVAAMHTDVKKGDTVEFPNSPPMENFTSKTLKKTFDKIIFAEALRVVK